MRLYDTLSGEKRDFAPLGEKVSMYVCGPNLYGPCHIGHALSYIVFDVLRRYLEHRDYKVHHVQNFTDIEDRIIEVSQRDDLSISELAERYIQRFHQEMDALGIMRAHDYPRATDYIDRMIEIVQRLICQRARVRPRRRRLLPRPRLRVVRAALQASTGRDEVRDAHRGGPAQGRLNGLRPVEGVQGG